MKKLALLAVFIVFMSGCASVAYIKIKPEKKELFNLFKSGVVQEVGVGEQMINFSINIMITPGFVATQDYTMPSPIGQTLPPITAGSKWKAVGLLLPYVEAKEDRKYICENTNKTEDMRATLHTGKKTGWKVCALVEASGNLYGWAVCPGAGWDTAVMFEQKTLVFEPIQIEEPNIKIRKVEIIYGGRIKEVLRLLYRDITGPQEFTYDLSESKNIRIKGIDIEVIDANNSSIKFIIKTKPEQVKQIIGV